MREFTSNRRFAMFQSDGFVWLYCGIVFGELILSHSNPSIYSKFLYVLKLTMSVVPVTHEICPFSLVLCALNAKQPMFYAMPRYKDADIVSLDCAAHKGTYTDVFLNGIRLRRRFMLKLYLYLYTVVCQ